MIAHFSGATVSVAHDLNKSGCLRQHLVYFISDLLEALDLTAILSWSDQPTRRTLSFPSPNSRQGAALPLEYPHSLLPQIARKLEDDIASCMLAANNTPDFPPIAEFRKWHLAALNGIFVQVLRLCRRLD